MEMKVLEAVVADTRLQGRLYVECADGALELTRVQPAGKRPMSGSDFLRGLRI